MEIFEDKRLRESGIDPNGDPIDMMRQVRLQHEAMLEEEGPQREAKEHKRSWHQLRSLLRCQIAAMRRPKSGAADKIGAKFSQDNRRVVP